MLHIQEIRKNPDGLVFEKKLDLAEELKERNPEILDVQDIVAKGKVQYEDGLYFLVLYHHLDVQSQYGASRTQGVLSSQRNFHGRRPGGIAGYD